jgi:hypothetical protein
MTIQATRPRAITSTPPPSGQSHEVLSVGCSWAASATKKLPWSVDPRVPAELASLRPQVCFFARASFCLALRISLSATSGL